METQNQSETALTLVDDAPRAVTPVTQLPASGIAAEVANLVKHNVSPDLLREYLAVRREEQAEQARRAFDAAMAAFKGEKIAKIVKKKRVHFNTKDSGVVDYKHETLDSVVDAVRIPMAKHGLSATWDPDQSVPGLIKVTCVVSHELGHSKRITLAGPPDTSGRKNPLQQVRSAITFLQRATLLLAVGLAAEGEDNDGRGSARPGQEPDGATGDDAPPPRASKKAGSTAPKATANGGNGAINAAQLKLLRGKIKSHDIDEVAALKHFDVDSLDKLPFAKLNDALQWADKHAR